MTPRESAYKFIKRVIEDGAYPNLLLQGESAFTRRLVLGCLERRLTLEYIIGRFARRKPDGDTTALLFIGIYQIMYMDVPDSAACDETVESAKKFVGKSRADFINAILRSVCRNKQQLEKDIDNAPESVKYSVSEDICAIIRGYYGELASNILNSFFGMKRMFLRVNTRLTDAGSVASLVGGTAVNEYTVEVTDMQNAVKHIDEGLYFVQGLPSQYTVDLLGLEEGMTVADVCACPGGKTFAAAIAVGESGRVYSSDIHSGKLKLVSEGASRLGLKNIEISKRDARELREDLMGKCDRVICDVPCSALGEMASRPDIRYKSLSDLDRLYETQKNILAAASKLLKNGGYMTYSTCTLNKRENEEALNSFLKGNSEFRLISSRTFLPFEDGLSEGFFAALIKKEEK